MIEIPPPIKAEKNSVNIYKQIFEIKCPNKLEGIIKSEYLNEVVIKLIFKFGTAFLILFKLSKDIMVIEIKNETIMLLM